MISLFSKERGRPGANGKRPEIHWFSPLPPARSEIANVIAWLGPVLAERFQVVLWTNQSRWDKSLTRWAEIATFDDSHPPWERFNRAAAVIYNIGNDVTFHGWILSVMERHRGIVILHDTVLVELLVGYYRHQTGRLCELARQVGGSAGAEAMRQLLRQEISSDEIAQRLPMTEKFLEGAQGVILHNHTKLSQVTSMTPAPILATPLPCGRAALDRSAVDRSQRQPPWRLIIFGFLNSPNRRLTQFIEAWAGHPQRDRFRLDLVGPIKNRRPIEIQLRELNIDRLTNLHGFVSEERLHSLLDQADLAINLRYPTRGESSGSQLRIWEHGLPSIVTKDGWYAALPEETVAFVDPANEQSDLQRHLSAFLENPGSWREMGLAGRRYLAAHHDPRLFAERLAEFIPVCAASRGLTAAALTAERWRAMLDAFPIRQWHGQTVTARAAELLRFMTV